MTSKQDLVQYANQLISKSLDIMKAKKSKGIHPDFMGSEYGTPKQHLKAFDYGDETHSSALQDIKDYVHPILENHINKLGRKVHHLIDPGNLTDEDNTDFKKVHSSNTGGFGHEIYTGTTPSGHKIVKYNTFVNSNSPYAPSVSSYFSR